MTAAARASQDIDTTRDTTDRIELLETASRVHWVKTPGMYLGYSMSPLACGTDTLWDRRSFGSAAAVTCARCARAFARQQPQQAHAAADGETTSE